MLTIKQWEFVMFIFSSAKPLLAWRDFQDDKKVNYSHSDAGDEDRADNEGMRIHPAKTMTPLSLPVHETLTSGLSPPHISLPHNKNKTWRSMRARLIKTYGVWRAMAMPSR